MQREIVVKAVASGDAEVDNYDEERTYRFQLVPKSYPIYVRVGSDFEDELICTFDFTKKRKK